MKELFESLNMSPSIVTALEMQNITTPTEIQRKVIPEILKNKDLIVQSETGTGKTLAYLIPVFEKLKALEKAMQAIIMVPTHELASQINRQIEHLSRNSEVKLDSALIIGKVNIERQIKKLKEKPQIIVGSPGRILELIKNRKISAHTVKTIILDEADRLMDDNNIEGVKAVIKTTLRERQIMMFSASISQDTIKRAKEVMKEPEIIRVAGKASVPSTIEHLYFVSEQRDKIEVLRKLIRILNPQKAIVFSNRGDEIENAVTKLKYHGIKAEGMHGLNEKEDRKRVMDGFRTGKLQILAATDIAARGLDIEGITHVINLNVPEDPDGYLHRVGRTGRNGNAGVAVSIVTKAELQLIKNFCKTLRINIIQKSMYMGKIFDSKRAETRV
jgi:superfamily II DNA/RNA helicase